MEAQNHSYFECIYLFTSPLMPGYVFQLAVVRRGAADSGLTALKFGLKDLQPTKRKEKEKLTSKMTLEGFGCGVSD